MTQFQDLYNHGSIRDPKKDTNKTQYSAIEHRIDHNRAIQTIQSHIEQTIIDHIQYSAIQTITIIPYTRVASSGSSGGRLLIVVVAQHRTLWHSIVQQALGSMAVCHESLLCSGSLESSTRVVVVAVVVVVEDSSSGSLQQQRWQYSGSLKMTFCPFFAPVFFGLIQRPI